MGEEGRTIHTSSVFGDGQGGKRKDDLWQGEGLPEDRVLF